jgi:Virulence factor membrane-bound polymerase, C-terminal/O-Antigen ligase
MAQANHLSSLLLLGVVGSLWFFERARIGSATTSVLVAFLGFGVVMTQSRSAWVAILAIAGCWLVMRKRLGSRTSPWAAAAGVLMFAGATSLWPTVNAQLELATVATVGQRLEAGTRTTHWSVLLDAIGHRPWGGYGWNQVSVAQQETALAHLPSGEWITYSHSTALDLLIWNGIPIGLAVLALVAVWLIHRIRRCVDLDSWVSLSGIAVLSVHALVEYPLAYTYFLLPLAMMVGPVETQRVCAKTSPNDLAPRAGLLASLLTLGSLTAWVGAEYVIVEEAERRIRLKEAGYAQASQNPWVPTEVRLLDGPRDFLWMRMTEPAADMTTADLDRLRRVTTRYAQPGSLTRYAIAAGLNGRIDDARRSLALLCNLWREAHCHRARREWAAWQGSHDALRAIEFPAAATAH